MRRLIVLTLIALSSLIISSFSTGIYTAQAAVTKMPIVLLVQRSYYVSETDGCGIDVEGQNQVLLKVNNAEGKRRGGVWFAKGEVVEATGPSGIAQRYCAFVRTADIEMTGVADLLLHDQHLTSVDLDQYVTDTHIVLEVDERGLVAEGIATPEEVRDMGLEPLNSVGTAKSAGSPTNRTGTRTIRTSNNSGVSRTSRSSETPTPTIRNDSETSRGTTSTTSTSRTSLQSGIVTGEWELEGDSEWDFIFVSIQMDLNGTGEEVVEELDPLDFAVEMGVPLIGEGQAPEGCRVFAYSGPLGIPLFLGACADGDYVLFAYGTDKDVIDDALEDFSNGDPFRVPYGYFEV